MENTNGLKRVGEYSEMEETGPMLGTIPVFNLHEVANQTVAGTTLHKVPLSREEFLAILWSKLILEVLEQGQLAVFLDLV